MQLKALRQQYLAGLGITLGLSAWYAGYFGNDGLWSWFGLIFFAYGLWSVASTWHGLNTKDSLVRGAIYGGVSVLIARFSLLLGVHYTYGSWSVPGSENYDIANGLKDVYRILLNGSFGQTVSIVLLGALIGILSASITKFANIRRTEKIEDFQAGLKVIGTVVGVGLLALIVAVSTDVRSTSLKRVADFLDYQLALQSQNDKDERQNVNLSDITYEELEELSRDYDPYAKLVSNYDIEAALSAEVDPEQQALISTPEQPSDDNVSSPQVADDQYEVKSGDTYACIAEKIYGDYKLWPKIMAENDGIGYHEHFLYVGNIVQLPDLPIAESTTHICD
ncbi:hypothetical protein KC878_00280 [Candidatus Saccharibacteria bacterium]|nr:hypothetical protein [Candidatus Saccharibacteria bacterium]MCB9821051.1 hypothetical protein [Candidatus Nomurabacteria bacterium]